MIVDEAHGAHLGLHPGLPRSALQCGADVVVQSTHKQLSALTQGAMLHAQGDLVSRRRLARALQALQSSSPSYLVMASLDAARAQAAHPAAHEGSLAAATHARKALARLPGVQLLTAEQAAACAPAQASGERSTTCSLDPLRLTVSLQRLGVSGYEAAQELEERHGIVPELATPTCVVLAFSIGSTLQHAQALVTAVQELATRHVGGGTAASSSDGSGSTVSSVGSDSTEGGGSSSSAGSGSANASLYAMKLTPRDAFFAAAEAVPAEQAVGRVSAELLCPYPPGVPAAYPGEVITPAVLQQLRHVQRQGGIITGCSDASLRTLQVVVERAVSFAVLRRRRQAAAERSAAKAAKAQAAAERSEERFASRQAKRAAAAARRAARRAAIDERQAARVAAGGKALGKPRGSPNQALDHR